MQLAVYFLAAAAAIGSSTFAFPWFRDPCAAGFASLPHGNRQNRKEDASPEICQYDKEDNTKAPLKNIFSALDGSEIAAVTSFLHKQRELNLTAAVKATSWDNTIDLVELLQPNKSDALPYLNGDGPAPDRYARVGIQFKATEEPYIQDYMVGPLPVSHRTKVQPLNYLYNKGVGKQRIYHADINEEVAFYAKIGASVADITLDLWNGTFMGLPNDTVFVKGFEPLQIGNQSVITWLQFWSYPIGTIDDRASVLPLGLHTKINIAGRDPSKWSVLGWYYNGNFYKTTEAFRKAYFSPGFQKRGANVDGLWAQLMRDGKPRPRDTLVAPVQVQPQGRRFGVDVKEKYIEWMGFSLYIGFTRDTGIRLFDVRYNGERIVYELGLEEALSHYASDEPMQSGVAFLDSLEGFGRVSYELVQGYDCPSDATFLNTSYFTNEETRTHANSICLFEMDSGHPLQRYASSNTVSVTKSLVFTIRSISAVGNYDFIFDYEFFLDGSIHVTARLSGYIQASYWAHSGDYGFRIRDNLSGSMHDHVISYKLDMDVNGTANSLLKTTVVPTRERYPWSDGELVNTMKLEKTFIDNERLSKLNWAPNSATTYTVINKDAKNIYGEYRGYRVSPVTSSTTYLTVQNSESLKRSGGWATHNLYALKRKDTEPHSTSSYNNLDVGDPVIDFNKFFDGESLDQEDLVLYFNLGMHHIPDTGDLPNTTAVSSMGIIPQNFHLENPSRATRQQIRLTFEEGKASQAEIFGSSHATCTFDMKNVKPNLAGYKGDIVVPKFPFLSTNMSFAPTRPGSQTRPGS
ncbi:Copper amine oxidase, putative [Coccidioides posadasii C735 delta SOWgp]|uniref:Amine oxidase n=1 Tax=Coccidioides posadasii (strain C735) TaxID=222929 RepID=C5PFX7_COCP7|nr:Copper amine oxidase, putative [Coccidioides posadasii C735 delta SOWgp]EER23430.1 Copper amine oxidase, putative [Coccidioides posadasii C735 delta SOWgp]|eukprot:XP_003065575.1 Copper amine oxidase, putative [Coccidioides posadasii C735 delta SOWgp]